MCVLQVCAHCLCGFPEFLFVQGLGCCVRPWWTVYVMNISLLTQSMVYTQQVEGTTFDILICTFNSTRTGKHCVTVLCRHGLNVTLLHYE